MNIGKCDFGSSIEESGRALTDNNANLASSKYASATETADKIETYNDLGGGGGGRSAKISSKNKEFEQRLSQLQAERRSDMKGSGQHPMLSGLM